MVKKVNFNKFEKKPLNEIQDENVLYQLVWYFTPKAEMLKVVPYGFFNTGKISH